MDNPRSDCDICSSLAGLKGKITSNDVSLYDVSLYDVSYDMNNDKVDEYAGHTRICKGGFGNAGDGLVWHLPTVCWQGSTGRFCGLNALLSKPQQEWARKMVQWRTFCALDYSFTSLVLTSGTFSLHSLRR